MNKYKEIVLSPILDNLDVSEREATPVIKDETTNGTAINFNKLRHNLPEGCVPIVDQADYFDEDKLQHLRKRTLDIGNETIRNIEGELDNYIIGFTFK